MNRLILLITIGLWTLSACSKTGQADNDSDTNSDTTSDSNTDTVSDDTSTDSVTASDSEGCSITCLNDIHVFGTSDIWAVGDCGAVLHYDGKDWQRYSLDDTHTFYSLWGSSREEMLVAGTNGEEGVLWRFNGEAWREDLVDDRTPRFTGVHGSAPDNVVVAGDNSVPFHYDGQSWKELPGIDRTFVKAFVTNDAILFLQLNITVDWFVYTELFTYSAGNLAPIGISGVSNSAGLSFWVDSDERIYTETYDGLASYESPTWTIEYQPEPTFDTLFITDIHGDDTGSVWAVTQHGVIYERYAGSWSELNLPGLENRVLTAIGSANGTVYGTGCTIPEHNPAEGAVAYPLLSDGAGASQPFVFHSDGTDVEMLWP